MVAANKKENALMSAYETISARAFAGLFALALTTISMAAAIIPASPAGILA